MEPASLISMDTLDGLARMFLTMQVQTALFAAAVWLIDALWTGAHPRVRLLLWTAALIKAVIPPVLPVPEPAAAAVSMLPVVDVVFGAPVAIAEAPAAVSPAVLLLVLSVTASLVLGVVALVRRVRLQRMLRDARPLPLESEQAGIPVLVADTLPSPLTLGTVRPRIYLSPDVVAGDAAARAAILEHERAHVRRHDNALVVVQTLVQILYALNPLVWLLNLRLFRYREQLCDLEALRRSGAAPVEYARVLISFAERNAATCPAFPVASRFFETRHGFAARIHALIYTRPERLRHRVLRLGIAAVATAALLPASFEWSVPESRTADQASMLSLLPSRVDAAAAVPDGSVDTQPAIRRATKPLRYPEFAHAAGISGMVMLRVRVSSAGRTERAVAVTSPNDMLTAAAREYAHGIRWTPATRNGRAVAAEVMLPVQFRLTDTKQEQKLKKVREDARTPAPSPAPGTDASGPVIGDREASIVGGLGEFSKHLRYPPEAVERKLEGMVILDISLGADGSVKEIRIESSTDPIFNAVAIDAADAVQWTPAVKNGVPVESNPKLPVRFRLQ